jgi:hypothetical protein
VLTGYELIHAEVKKLVGSRRFHASVAQSGVKERAGRSESKCKEGEGASSVRLHYELLR